MYCCTHHRRRRRMKAYKKWSSWQRLREMAEREIAEKESAERRKVYDDAYNEITDRDIVNLINSDSDTSEEAQSDKQTSDRPLNQRTVERVPRQRVVPPTILSETKMVWTPQSISDMSVRWVIVGESPQIIVHVSTTNGQVLAARVHDKTTSGWRIMFNPSGRLILYPTNAHNEINR